MEIENSQKTPIIEEIAEKPDEKPQEKAEDCEEISKEDSKSENELKNSNLKVKSLIPKAFHLHHDLNQLCFEKRERKNVDRFGFTAKKSELIKEKKIIMKMKKSKLIHSKMQEKTRKTEEKTEEKIIGKTEEKIIGKNEEKTEEKTEEKNGEKIVFSKEKTQENGKINEEQAKKHEKPEGKSKEISEILPKKAIFSKSEEITNEFPLKKEILCEEIVELSVKNGKEEPLKRKKPITPLNFLRKRGRKRKGKWGNKRNYEENCPLTNSLNKIFKKNGAKKPLIQNKTVNNIEKFQTPNLFENVFRSIFVKEILPQNSNELEQKTQVSGEKNEEIPFNLKPIPHDLSKIESQEEKVNMINLLDSIQNINRDFLPVKSYINCDLRYFNFNFLVEKIGFFDIILMDPPWRIKGGQQNDSQFMFSNNKFSLDYNTMSNQAILNLHIEKLSQKGFIFLWILNTQMNVGYEMLNKWGYEVIDQIIWVKLKDNKIFMTHGYYFMHSFEICLVGYKCPIGEYVEYHSKVSNNLIFAEVRKKSQKPDELYEIIDLLMPGAKKIELFARNNNLKSGWLSLGNQLGETYDKWLNVLECNNCKKNIMKGVQRYKSRKMHNYDLCKDCMVSLALKKEEFFEMRNDIDEDVLHHYHKCNQCETEPIWGIRFACQECENYDLCEACFDENLTQDIPFHCIDHKILALELPLLANGLPAHCDNKCNGCYQKPIIGPCFSCTVCNNFSLCQGCFFIKNDSEFINSKNHKANHKMEIKIEPENNLKKKGIKCAFCEMDLIEGAVYKCENCFNFYFCLRCYDKKQEFKTNMATTHKPYHNFVKLF